MTGHAIGSSTKASIRHRARPIPRADSTTAGDTDRNPTMELPITGIAAKKASITNEGVTPSPNGMISSASRASVGMVSATRCR